jgi:3-oxoacyl-[acyl-carrier-protein] synthase II
MIAGGAESAICESGIGGFASLRALSTNFNDEPTRGSRPWDKSRDGFVMGEGAGALILEEYEHAIKREAKIYAEVAGGGLSADAYHMTAPHPEGIGARNVMISALDDANMQPTDVDYINVHGTSTPLGDIAETKAIRVAGTIATALIQGIKIPMINIPPKGAVKQLKLLGIISTMLRSCTKTSMP